MIPELDDFDNENRQDILKCNQTGYANKII